VFFRDKSVFVLFTKGFIDKKTDIKEIDVIVFIRMLTAISKIK